MTVIQRNFNPSCSNCGLQGICFPMGLEHADINRLDQIVNHKPRLDKGEILYHSHDAFDAVYAIRSGMLKLYSNQEDGTEVIHGFYFPGDVVGFDGIETGVYQLNVEAIESSTLCEIPYNQLQSLSMEVPNLSMHLYHVLSKKMNDSYYQAQLLAIKSAEQRLANFLYHTAERVRARGFDEFKFHLPILHREVANYIGLTPETVSRLLTQFHKKGIVTWKKRQVTMHDKDVLRNLAGIPEVIEQSCIQCVECRV